MQQFITYAMHKVGGKWLLYAYALPGVVLHEASHAVVALLVGHKVEKVALFSPDDSGTLGYVVHAYPVGVISDLRNVLIGFAPLVGGGLGWYVAAERLGWFTLLGVIEKGGSWPFAAWEWLKGLNGTEYVMVYVMLSVIVFMTPSGADLRGAWRGLVLILFGCIGWWMFEPQGFESIAIGPASALIDGMLPAVVIGLIPMAILALVLALFLKLGVWRRGGIKSGV